MLFIYVIVHIQNSDFRQTVIIKIIHLTCFTTWNNQLFLILEIKSNTIIKKKKKDIVLCILL